MGGIERRSAAATPRRPAGAAPAIALGERVRIRLAERAQRARRVRPAPGLRSEARPGRAARARPRTGDTGAARFWRPSSITSVKPSVAISAARAVRPSSRAFVATVMPCAKRVTAPGAAPASASTAATARITPRCSAAGVEGAFAVWTAALRRHQHRVGERAADVDAQEHCRSLRERVGRGRPALRAGGWEGSAGAPCRRMGGVGRRSVPEDGRGRPALRAGGWEGSAGAPCRPWIGSGAQRQAAAGRIEVSASGSRPPRARGPPCRPSAGARGSSRCVRAACAGRQSLCGWSRDSAGARR